MNIKIRKYVNDDLPEMTEIWNEIVKEGDAFPQTDCLDSRTAEDFFSSQTYTAVAVDEESGSVLGLYILHPNNIGRCSHICNASYAVKSSVRGAHIGEKLVKHCLAEAKECGFGILQFNAVVLSNIHARNLYERLGFRLVGIVPEGFRKDGGEYEDICIYYHKL